MEFRVLGPLEVLDGVEPIDITAPKQRRLLTVLLISANEVVPVDQIIERLWDGDPPRSATAALQMHASGLRRALEPARASRSPGRFLVCTPPGYRLVVDERRYDAARFTSSVAEARGHLASGDPGAARHLLDAALSLCGDQLTSSSPSVHSPRQRSLASSS